MQVACTQSSQVTGQHLKESLDPKPQSCQQGLHVGTEIPPLGLAVPRKLSDPPEPLGRTKGPSTYIHTPTGSDLQTCAACALIHGPHIGIQSLTRLCSHHAHSSQNHIWSLSISPTPRGPGMHPSLRRSEWELSHCVENKIKYPLFFVCLFF